MPPEKEITQIRTISDVLVRDISVHDTMDGDSQSVKLELGLITSKESLGTFKNLLSQRWRFRIQMVREEDIREIRPDKKSEFGEGLIYPFVLGLIHAAEMVVKKASKEEIIPFVEFFFNSSSDHLLGIVLLDHMPADTYALTEQVKEFAAKRRYRGYTQVEEARKEFETFMNLVRELAFSMDRGYGNVPVEADYG